MIDVFICVGNIEDSTMIKNCCTQYYINRNYDSEIYECKDGNSLINLINNYELTALYFLECSELTDLLIERLRDSAKGSYIILMSQRKTEILERISPSLRPSGYLTMPVDKTCISNIVSKICEQYENNQGKSEAFRFKIKSRIYCVDIKNIDYFEAANKKMVIRTNNQEYEYYDNFENIIASLPDYFIRTHKSFLVNMKNVKNIDFKEMWISCRDGAVAYISRGYKKDVEDYVSRGR